MELIPGFAGSMWSSRPLTGSLLTALGDMMSVLCVFSRRSGEGRVAGREGWHQECGVCGFMLSASGMRVSKDQRRIRQSPFQEMRSGLQPAGKRRVRKSEAKRSKRRSAGRTNQGRQGAQSVLSGAKKGKNQMQRGAIPLATRQSSKRDGFVVWASARRWVIDKQWVRRGRGSPVGSYRLQASDP